MWLFLKKRNTTTRETSASIIERLNKVIDDAMGSRAIHPRDLADALEKRATTIRTTLAIVRPLA